MAKDNKRQKTIILSGGGTGGSVTPLLAVARKLWTEDPNLRLIFVGGNRGPERELVATCTFPNHKLEFKSLPAGKLRRYFAWQNFLDIFKIFAAFFLSLNLIRKEKPGVVVSAGSFVSVPLAWAAYIFRVPVVVHQQDVRPGLANRLMAPFARLVTVVFEKSLRDYGLEAVWIGNPFNEPDESINNNSYKASCGLCPTKPFLLVTGGGTGSVAINELVFQSVAKLSASAQIMHLTGKGKLPVDSEREKLAQYSDYHVADLLGNDEVFNLMTAADLVVSRCGLSTLTELSALAKPAILIPMPKSHQEDNAAVFAQAKAAIILHQSEIDAEKFTETVLQILHDPIRREELSRNIGRFMKKDGAQIMASFILEILK